MAITFSDEVVESWLQRLKPAMQGYARGDERTGEGPVTDRTRSVRLKQSTSPSQRRRSFRRERTSPRAIGPWAQKWLKLWIF